MEKYFFSKQYGYRHRPQIGTPVGCWLKSRRRQNGYCLQFIMICKRPTCFDSCSINTVQKTQLLTYVFKTGVILRDFGI